ncbi:CHAT domain-containing protein [Amycolatopsis sp. NPDC051061]|uniref:CHAT domain-containing protein n=1 Tax=Amycolatopsis sp. NPDC051061 TaxID=3155042 RepID=UPI00344949E0
MDDMARTRITYATNLLMRWLAAPGADVAELEHADKLFAVALAGRADDETAPYLHDHASALYELFKAKGDRTLLDRAIAREREALECASSANPDLCVLQASLAAMLTEPVPGGHSLEAAATVSALVTAVVPALEQHRLRAPLTCKVAYVLLASPHPDLHAVEDLVRAALAVEPTDPLDTAKLRVLLADILVRRFAETGDRDDLEHAIEAAEASVGSAPTIGPVRVAGLMCCAEARHTRWKLTDRTEDLAAAVDLRKIALRVKPEKQQLSDLYTGLCVALRDRFERFDTPSDLDEAVQAGVQAVRTRDRRPAPRALSLATLSAAYRTRFESTRQRKDLLRAVGAARAAVDVAEAGDPQLLRHLGTLTLALLSEFKFRRRYDRAAEAIRAGQAAVALARPVGHPLLPALLANVANVLRERYEWAGDLADLDRAIALLRESVDTTEPGHPGRFRRRAGLGAALLRRFESTGSHADVDQAVRETEASVREAPPAHPQRARLQVNEGLALFRRFEADGNEHDLDACIKAYRAAVGSAQDSRSEPGPWSYQLSAPLRERYLLSGDEADLTEALVTAAAGARKTGDGGAWFNTGMALLFMYEKEKLAGEDTGAGLRAESAFAQCVAATGTPLLVHASAALRLGRLSGERKDWKTADAAYGIVLAALPELTGRHLGWDSRHRMLARFAGLGADAAAVAMWLGDRERAVSILERTRGIVLGQALDHSQDVEAVRLAAPGLADEFTQLAGWLATDTGMSTEFVADEVASDDPAARRRDIAGRWTSVVEKIRRTVPGQEAFLSPPKTDDLLGAAADGVVVIVNASRHRSDALIIRDHQIDSVRLADEVWHAGRPLAEQVTTVADELNDVVVSALDWISLNITGPVLERLASGVGRIWWMPIGELSALPLSAAVPRQSGPARIVSSTTTTLRALLDSHRIRPTKPTDAQLVVAMSKTAGYRPLPRAAAEAEAVAGRLGSRVAPLVDAAATSSAVSATLRNALIAHFACHAIMNLTDPAASAILLTLRRLSVRDIAALPKLDRILVYLSACTTAHTGGLLADEAMHLASAFQLIGFRSVIGTLWKIDDDIAIEVADSFYRLLSEGHEPSTALHDAVDTVRGQYLDSPALWAGFVHFGP